jgi:hypothetical protein
MVFTANFAEGLDTDGQFATGRDHDQTTVAMDSEVNILHKLMSP